jgi:hypothetical protein
MNKSAVLLVLLAGGAAFAASQASIPFTRSELTRVRGGVRSVEPQWTLFISREMAIELSSAPGVARCEQLAAGGGSCMLELGGCTGHRS